MVRPALLERATFWFVVVRYPFHGFHGFLLSAL